MLPGETKMIREQNASTRLSTTTVVTREKPEKFSKRRPCKRKNFSWKFKKKFFKLQGILPFRQTRNILFKGCGRHNRDQRDQKQLSNTQGIIFFWLESQVMRSGTFFEGTQTDQIIFLLKPYCKFLIEQKKGYWPN